MVYFDFMMAAVALFAFNLLRLIELLELKEEFDGTRLAIEDRLLDFSPNPLVGVMVVLLDESIEAALEMSSF